MRSMTGLLMMVVGMVFSPAPPAFAVTVALCCGEVVATLISSSRVDVQIEQGGLPHAPAIEVDDEFVPPGAVVTHLDLLVA